MHEHIVRSFDQLQQLDKKIAQMGGLAERLLAQGFGALGVRSALRAAVASDRSIDLLGATCRSRPS
jgi:phosphate transport system protein